MPKPWSPLSGITRRSSTASTPRRAARRQGRPCHQGCRLRPERRGRVLGKQGFERPPNNGRPQIDSAEAACDMILSPVRHHQRRLADKPGARETWKRELEPNSLTSPRPEDKKYSSANSMRRDWRAAITHRNGPAQRARGRGGPAFVLGTI